MILLIQYTIVFASVLMLVALGGCFSEHSGVINIGLEGIMVVGALGGALVMKSLGTTSAFVMVLVAMLVAAMAGMLHDLYAYKVDSYDDHAHRGANLAFGVLSYLELTTPEETDIIYSAVYHHDDKLVTDSPMDELLKDADVIDHCLKDTTKPVKEKEQARYEALCKELGL